jgi:hypothetical protein
MVRIVALFSFCLVPPALAQDSTAAAPDTTAVAPETPPAAAGQDHAAKPSRIRLPLVRLDRGPHLVPHATGGLGPASEETERRGRHLEVQGCGRLVEDRAAGVRLGLGAHPPVRVRDAPADGRLLAVPLSNQAIFLLDLPGVAEHSRLPGITTEIVGNCGFSAFPLRGATLAEERDYYMVERVASEGDRAPHRERRRHPDVEPVDLVGRRGADSEPQRPGPDPFCQHQPDACGQDLAVAEAAHGAALGRKYDGRGDHWNDGRGQQGDFARAPIAPQEAQRHH